MNSESVNNNTTNQERFLVIVPTKKIMGLQEALNDRFLNDGNTVKCSIEGCSGLQALKIGVQKCPPFL